MTDPNTQAIQEQSTNTETQTDASKLKTLRKALGKNQFEMAAALGCSQSMVSFMEKGKRPISDEVKKVMTGLEATIRG